LGKKDTNLDFEDAKHRRKRHSSSYICGLRFLIMEIENNRKK
jgi:hypothetical protein